MTTVTFYRIFSRSALIARPNAGVVLGTMPVVMGALAIAAFGERPSWRFLAAITVATAGVLLITLRLDTEGVAIPSLQHSIGIGLVLMAVVCEALFLLLNKKLAKPMPALTLSALMSAFGFVLAIGPAGIEIASGATEHVTRAAVIVSPTMH